MYSFPLNFPLFLKIITLQNSDDVSNALFPVMLSSKYLKFAQLYLLSFYCPQAERAILG